MAHFYVISLMGKANRILRIKKCNTHEMALWVIPSPHVKLFFHLLSKSFVDTVIEPVLLALPGDYEKRHPNI